MNKLTKLMLASTMMISGAMAAPESLPGVIENGATLYINRDMKLDKDVQNYGLITTEVGDGNANVTGSGKIYNMTTVEITDLTDDEIIAKNSVSGGD